MIKRLDNIEASELQFRLDNKNDDFTLIARDCIGGILYHQLGLKFLTPTINLFLTPKSVLKSMASTILSNSSPCKKLGNFLSFLGFLILLNILLSIFINFL